MATQFHMPVTAAAQVGTYFVGQYYQVLQQQPEYAYQFYSDASTMLRIDGNSRETATAMLKIHALIMSLNYSGIEIKTAHSLESWNGGVLVMVSGSVHLKEINRRRKFVQNFFLAPQENGYFVLNDIFHFVDEEHILQHPVSYLTQNNFDAKLGTPNSYQDQLSNYILGGDLQAREYTTPGKIEENIPANNYGFAEEQLQEISEPEHILDNNFGIHSNGSLHNTVNAVHEHLPTPIQEPVEEIQKHTYASILAKAQSTKVVQPSSFKGNASSEWLDISEPPSQPSVVSSNHFERSVMDTVEEPSAVEDDVEFKSVYVRNVPSTMAASEIEEEFRKFGKLSPAGVAIRTRKDIDVCYAFVEYEDIISVQNAIKASTIEIGGHQLYIEGRRPNRNGLSRGRGRGRGRGGYPFEGMRGRFGGRSFGRVTGQDSGDRDYNRARGNGLYRQATRHERPYVGNPQGSRDGQNS
ncbi:RNA metabolism protein [Lithospermum erythrorhizon]|uniref:RNA metabolism protein n=1 Tax=Lithospermum erythrorhizon TaxID=34254 RepID=A0AAV3QRV4_LITER